MIPCSPGKSPMGTGLRRFIQVGLLALIVGATVSSCGLSAKVVGPGPQALIFGSCECNLSFVAHSSMWSSEVYLSAVNARIVGVQTRDVGIANSIREVILVDNGIGNYRRDVEGSVAGSSLPSDWTQGRRQTAVRMPFKLLSRHVYTLLIELSRPAAASIVAYDQIRVKFQVGGAFITRTADVGAILCAGRFSVAATQRCTHELFVDQASLKGTWVPIAQTAYSTLN